MYGGQGLDEKHRSGSTDCASNLQRARKREARRGQTAQRLFGLFRLWAPRTNPSTSQIVQTPPRTSSLSGLFRPSASSIIHCHPTRFGRITHPPQGRLYICSLMLTTFAKASSCSPEYQRRLLTRASCPLAAALPWQGVCQRVKQHSNEDQREAWREVARYITTL